MEKLVAAADSSGAWYDRFPEHMNLSPRDFAWSYIQRSGRIDPERLAKISPRFARDLRCYFPTTLVGSYPQPEWLIDRKKLAGRFPPRVRARELWRVPRHYLAEAQDDATLLAIRAQEQAGLDIVTDGEIRRESYSNRFATALEGVDIDNPGTALDRSGHPNPVPRIVGKIRRKHRGGSGRPAVSEKAHAASRRRSRCPGPFTMSQQAQNDFYKSDEEAAMDYAAAVNEEIRDLFAAGADIVQIDEPYMQARPEKAREYGLKALNRALEGIDGHDRGAHLLRLCGDHPRAARRAIRSCRSSPARRCKQISIETAQSNLDCSVLQRSRARRSWSAASTCPT